MPASLKCALWPAHPSSFILCGEENVKYPEVNDVLDDSDVMMIMRTQGGSSCVNVALIIVSVDVTPVTGSPRANNTATISASLTSSSHTS